eukprot:Phypoly_transcript_11119.p2 GENE.Phypoly_transcript_11119~~Phypoly_transcript_11119.p2  ORF type:complete len:162 (+),score=30.63 Phypoly_transcript_11119:182-667(+)
MAGSRKYEILFQNSSSYMTVKVSMTTTNPELGDCTKEFVLPPNLMCTILLDYGVVLDAISYFPVVGTTQILASHVVTKDEDIEFPGDEEDYPTCYVVLENNTGGAVLVRAEGCENQVKIEPGDAEGTSLPLGTIITATKFDGSPINPSTKMILGHEVINFV